MAVLSDPVDIDGIALPEGLHLYAPMTAQLRSASKPAIVSAS
jgi:hypothetical protein